MPILLYNALLFITLALFSPLWLTWLATVPKMRAGFWEKLGFYPEDLKAKLQSQPASKRIWLHAVSVGEFNAAKPLINQLRQEGYALVLSTTTATGNQVARNSYPDLPILYFPFDLFMIVPKALKLIRPDLIVIMETEIWPNLLYFAKRSQIPVMMVNGRLSQRSFKFYVYFKDFFGWVFSNYHLMLMQSERDVRRIRELGAPLEKVLMGGNIKFDMPALQDETQAQQLQQLFGFEKDAPIVVFASTHKGEEEICLEMLTQLQQTIPRIKAVLAPRHPERAEAVSDLLRSRNIVFAKRSQLSLESPARADHTLILLDTVGELNAVFQIGAVACIGGSFIPWGGHNPLEPINARIPVVFGPYMDNFKAISQQVTEANAGYQAQTAEEATKWMIRLLKDPALYEQMVECGQVLMARNRGVTGRWIEHIHQAVGNPGT